MASSFVSVGAATPVLPSVGTAESGIYRNLFAEMGKTEAEISNKTNLAFMQLFHGAQGIFYPIGSYMAYIMDISKNEVPASGMAYGMMICVQMDRQTEFNQLWKWAKKYMYNSTGQFKGYFSRSCRTSGETINNVPSTVAEEYFLMSLLFAARKWGSLSGIYNYTEEAKSLMDAMLHQADDGVGANMFDLSTVFGSINGLNVISNPSYHLPAFYELLSVLQPGRDASSWRRIADNSRDYLKRAINITNGLVPDYSPFRDSPRIIIENEYTFSYDAWLVASNIAMDHTWWKKNEWATTYADALQNFFYNQGLTDYGDEYSLSGRKLRSGHSTGLVAMNAVASLAATKPIAYEFVNELWNAKIPTANNGYYNGILYLIGLLQCGGNFRMCGYGPIAASTPTPTYTPINTPTPVSTNTPLPSTSKMTGTIIIDGVTNPAANTGFNIYVSNLEYKTVTDENGNFEINDIPLTMSAALNIVISKPGYLTKALYVTPNMSSTGNILVFAGDVTGDGSINMSDVVDIAKSFNTASSDPRYKAVRDLNKDNAINMLDIMLLSKHFNATNAPTSKEPDINF